MAYVAANVIYYENNSIFRNKTNSGQMTVQKENKNYFLVTFLLQNRKGESFFLPSIATSVFLDI